MVLDDALEGRAHVSSFIAIIIIKKKNIWREVSVVNNKKHNVCVQN